MTGARPGRAIIALRAGALALSVLLLAAYFFQTSTLGPNHTDEGLLIEYVDDMASGMKPFYDFVDAYGILNWVFPVLFYRAANDHVWGIRIWMIVLKVITVLTAYVLLRALAADPAKEGSGRSGHTGGRFYAVLGCIALTELLGASWHSLQTPYAFMTVIPLVLGAWHFIVSPPLARPVLNVLIAALLIAAAIWTKLNTGMYLLAGGLFSYFVWLPVDLGEKTASASPAERLVTSRAQWAGVLAYAVLFTLYTRQYANVGFFVYLTVPLVLCLGWAAHVALAVPPERPREHVAGFALLLTVTALLSLTVLFGYYGRQAGVYVRELAGILSSIKYTAPFPEPGKPTFYIGLNDFYWLQIPILTTVLFAFWMALGKRFGERTFGAEWPRRRARVSALFTLGTLHGFVLYARADETHIYQDLVLSVPVAVVIFSQLDAFLRAAPPTPQAHGIFRFAVTGFVPFYFISLLVLPDRHTFDISRSDWHNRKLEHLRYSREKNPYLKDFSADISDHDWDVIEDDSARYVKTVTYPGEEVLLLTANRLLHFNSETRPVGGRYHFYFYLVSVGLLDREGFDRNVPKEILSGILLNPPRVLVAGLGHVPLAEAFPELARLRDTQYERTRSFRHIWVYERKW